MSLDRFQALAESYGAQPSRWPEAERALYTQYARTPRGRQVLEEAARLDDFLDALQPRAADPLRAARVVRAAVATRQRQRRGLAWATGAWAASALLGFVLGYQLPGTNSDASDDSYTQLLLGNTVLEDYL